MAEMIMIQETERRLPCQEYRKPWRNKYKMMRQTLGGVRSRVLAM
jgi:hypothetical protein